MPIFGRHLLIEYEGIEADRLNDLQQVAQWMRNAAEASGATIVHSKFHPFSPTGISGVVIIQESHLTIHTWPELGYAAVDIFTCGEDVDPRKACSYLEKAFNATHCDCREFPRGPIHLPERTTS